LTLHSNDFFSVVSSETSFPAAKESASPNLWKHAEVPAVFNNTPLFYQHLLNTPLSEAVCQEIAMEIKEEQLVTCSDGACGPGITPYFKTDHDLLEVKQSLLQLIPITIATQWVKGHYTGLDRQYQHTLNETADQVAGEYQRFQYPHCTICKPIPPPDYRVQ